MRIGVVTFPGSLDDRDAARAVRVGGAEPIALWHADPSLHDVDAVILPGGFSYGDYLRAGAIARFAPVMESIIAAARDGLPVLGICNGFQVLCESHLLPGALVGNAGRKFVCRAQTLRIENNIVLLDEATDAGDLGHAFSLRQGEFQIPILDGARIGEVQFLRHHRVLVNPTNARRVRPDGGRHARW